MESINCEECVFWDDWDYRCLHPDNLDPEEIAMPDDGCDFGERE